MVGRAYTRVATALLQEGDTVIDVGGNVGHFSAVCAAVVGDAGTVHVIEANPTLCDRLRDMADEVPGGPVVVHGCAVWSRSGVTEFHVATETGWSSLVENPTFETACTMVVETTTIDDFVHKERISEVRLLKLDIEGAETDALLGAKESLGRGLFEWILLEAEPQRLRAFGRNGEEISSLMERNGYAPVAVVREDRLMPVDEAIRIPGTFNGDYLYRRRLPAGEGPEALFRG
jgi:FkbM family methyltransferase